MKLNTGALNVLLIAVTIGASVKKVDAFSNSFRPMVTPGSHHAITRNNKALFVSTNSEAGTEISVPTMGGRSRQEIENELSSGKALEGGPVIDFGSVKDQTSRAERALLNARQEYEAAGGVLPQSGRLMGINDEVVREVGHEIGVFTTDEKIQQCASYLRSKAAEKGIFEWDLDVLTPSVDQFTEEQVKEFDALLNKAYEESGRVTEAFAKTFYLGTQLLPTDAAKAIWAIYVWCRRTDEIVDAPRESEGDDEMLNDLSAWEIRLEQLFKYGKVNDVLDLCFLDCKIRYPSMPIQPFDDMIRGMLMDIPGLGQERYETFDELHLYCYRVAGTVGLMSMPVWGCAEGYTEADAKEPALSLGVAFQITNILRDVGEDAATRGRIYLPRQDMERFGVTEEQIMAKRVDENYIALMKHEIARARMYYARAKRGVPMLSEFSRLPVQSALDCYGKILDKIEENGYDTLTTRAYVGKWEKTFETPFSWYRTQDIASVFPLPWDKTYPADETDL